MTDVDAIARLLDVGFNAVLLWMLYTIYRDFQAQVKRHADYLEKLVEQLLPDNEAPTLPTPPQRYQTVPQPYTSRTPTELRDADRVGI